VVITFLHRTHTTLILGGKYHFVLLYFLLLVQSRQTCFPVFFQNQESRQTGHPCFPSNGRPSKGYFFISHFTFFSSSGEVQCIPNLSRRPEAAHRSASVIEEGQGVEGSWATRRRLGWQRIDDGHGVGREDEDVEAGMAVERDGCNVDLTG
jgi:hypothetical protein